MTQIVWASKRSCSAGQECPAASGIPLGLGAGFKLIEKDHRDKDKLKEKEHDSSHAKCKEREEVDESNKDVPYIPSGWTSMIEDWLCSGTQLHDASSQGAHLERHEHPEMRSLSEGDLTRNVTGRDQGKARGRK